MGFLTINNNSTFFIKLLVIVSFLALTLYSYQLSTNKVAIKSGAINSPGDYEDLLSFIKQLKEESLELKQLRERISEKKLCEPNSHSVCFIGKRFCHPGYTGDDCSQKLVPANPWYSEDCPNLKQDITFDINMPLEMFYTKDNCSSKEISGITGCANLCFSHPVSGVPQIPLAFWKQVNKNEADFWKRVTADNDRIQEHLQGFNYYKSLTSKILMIY